jgi:hypothetical protein
MTYRTFIDVLDKYYGQGNPDYRQEEDVKSGVVPLETIFQCLSYKVNQVFNDHCSQAYTQTYDGSQEIEKPVP